MSVTLETLVAPNSSVPKQDLVDIVLIPCLGQKGLESWTSEETPTSEETLWPRDFLPKTVKNARILYILYPGDTGASNETPTSYADEICDKLHKLREDSKSTDRPVILVAHSLGGIVSAQILVRGRAGPDKSASKAISQKIKGMVFFGTPFSSSKKKSFEKIIEDLETTYDPPESTAEESKVLLDPFSSALCEHLQENKQARVMAFYEGVNGRGAIVVSDAVSIPSLAAVSGELNGRATVAPLARQNRDMVQFGDDEEKGGDYKLVAKTLEDFSNVKKTQDNEKGLGHYLTINGQAENVSWTHNGNNVRVKGAYVDGNVQNMYDSTQSSDKDKSHSS